MSTCTMQCQHVVIDIYFVTFTRAYYLTKNCLVFNFLCIMDRTITVIDIVDNRHCFPMKTDLTRMEHDIERIY